MYFRRRNSFCPDFSRPEAFQVGEVRLRQVLPEAYAQALEGGFTAEARIPAAAALLPHITENNLRSLMVYRVEKGWVADLVLVDLPGGLPNRVGIPEREALPTEEEAVAEGFDMLVGLLTVSEFPIFELCGYSVPLARANLDSIRKSKPARNIGYRSLDDARARICSVLQDYLPGGFTLGGFFALPEEESRHITAVLHLAALSGVVFYP